MSQYGQAMLLTVRAAVDEYVKQKHVRAPAVDIRKLMELCIAEGYLSEQELDGKGLHVRVTPSKGWGFTPVFSGLILGEAAILSTGWGMFGTSVVTSVVWLVLLIVHVLKW
jgi:hypothetical protein